MVYLALNFCLRGRFLVKGGGGGRYKCLVVAFHAYTANVEKVM